MYKCCERFGFGAVGLATGVTKLLFPLNVSAKNVYVTQLCA